MYHHTKGEQNLTVKSFCQCMGSSDEFDLVNIILTVILGTS